MVRDSGRTRTYIIIIRIWMKRRESERGNYSIDLLIKRQSRKCNRKTTNDISNREKKQC